MVGGRHNIHSGHELLTESMQEALGALQEGLNRY